MGTESKALHAIVRVLSLPLNVKLFQSFVQPSDTYGLSFRNVPLTAVVENRLEECASISRKVDQMMRR